MVYKLILALVLTLVQSSAFAWPSSGQFSNIKTYNAVTDLGFACDGVTNDTQALANAGDTFRAFQLANPGRAITLAFPPNRTCNMTGCTASQNDMFKGVTDLTINLTGSTISPSPCNRWGQEGFTIGINSGINWRTNAVNPGDTCATMTTAGSESNYAAGRWVILSGMGLQTTSFPPNYQFFEYKQIASINTVAHQVCFTSSVVNKYPTNYPDWSQGSIGPCGGPPCGGPPYLVGMAYPGFVDTLCYNGGGLPRTCKWDTSITFVGGTYSSPGQWIIDARNVRFYNVTSNGSGCWAPSNSQNVLFINSTIINCDVEMDKEVENMQMSGGHIHRAVFQSTSVENFTMSNGALIDLMTGTPGLSLTCNSSTLGDLIFGNNFGNTSDQFVFNGNGCNFTGGPNGTNRPGCCTFSSGRVIPIFISSVPHFTLTAPSSGILQCTDAVDVQCHDVLDFGGPNGFWILNLFTTVANGFPFQATDLNLVTFGPPHVIQNLTTTLTVASLSSLPTDGGGNTSYVPDFTRNWNCINCTGGPSAVDLSQPGAQGKPFSAYTQKTYTCQANVPNVPNSVYSNNSTGQFGITGLIPLVGNFVSATINVITPDTNGSLASTNVDLFRDGTTMVVNTKLTGSRTITTSTTSGAQSGDTLATRTGWTDQTAEQASTPDPQPLTGPGNYDTLSSDPTKCAVWTIEVITTR